MDPLKSKLSRRSFGRLMMSVPVAAAFGGILTPRLQQTTAAQSLDGPANGHGAKAPDTSKWHINYQSYHGGHKALAPVVINYVTGYLDGSTWRRRVGLQNMSSSKVLSVELTAHIHSEERPEALMAKSQLAPISWPNGVAAGAQVDVDGQDDLVKMFEPLLQDGKLNGYYHIDVTVSKVFNQDGSTWEFKELPS